MASVFILKMLYEDYDSCSGGFVELPVGAAATLAEVVDYLQSAKVAEPLSDEVLAYADDPFSTGRGPVIEEVALGVFNGETVLRRYNWRGEALKEDEHSAVDGA